MKIILDKKHTLYSDSSNIWITRKTIPTKKDGTLGNEVEEQISGYHADLDSLLNSMRWRKIRGCNVKSIEALAEEIKSIDKEIVKFSKEISKFVKDSRKGEK